MSMGGCSYRDHPRSTPSSIPATTHINPSRSQCTHPVDFEFTPDESPLSPQDFLSPVQTQHSSTPAIVVSQPQSIPSNSQPSLATPFDSTARFTHYTTLDSPYDASIRAEAAKASARLNAHSRKANAIKAKTTISAFIWETKEQPLAQQYQSCLADGHFVINEDFLSVVGLASKGTTFHFYYYNLREWQVVREGFSIPVSKLQKRDGVPVVMIKVPSVKAPEGVDELLGPINGSDLSGVSISEQRRRFKEERNQDLIALGRKLQTDYETTSSRRSLTPFSSHPVTPIPSRSLTPVLSRSLTPVPSRSLTPVPSHSLTPVPLHSLTPIPSHSLTPIQSSTPFPSHSLTPVPSAPSRRAVSVQAHHLDHDPMIPPPTPCYTSPVPSTKRKCSVTAQDQVVIEISDDELDLAASPQPPKKRRFDDTPSIQVKVEFEDSTIPSPDSAINDEYEPSLDEEPELDEPELDEPELPSPGVEYPPVFRRFPKDYYVFEINEYFRRLAVNERKFPAERSTVKDIWLDYFYDSKNPRYPHSNVQNVERRWKAASEAVRNRFIRLGRRPAGLWSAFMKAVPSPDAPLNTARKQKARADNRTRLAQLQQLMVERHEDGAEVIVLESDGSDWECNEN
jgi:hypothetical protein